MKSVLARVAATAALALLACLLIAAAAAPKKALQSPNKLVILSTTDVKGKTSPCG